MPELRDPVPTELAQQLAAAVLEHRARPRRPEHPAAAHAGRPGGLRTLFVAPWPGHAGRTGSGVTLDHAARSDVVGRLLDGLAAAGGQEPTPLLWLTRPASHEEPDEDRAWLAAVLTAAGERGLDPWWAVVTDRGWHDPRSGTTGSP